MATAEALKSASTPPTETDRRRRFNVDEYYRMAKAGILKPDERVELIEGEILVMSPIGSPHAGCVSCMSTLFYAVLAARATIFVQNPLRLGPGSEPEPDVMLLKPRADFYRKAHPGPADVLLLVEVMDSSAQGDRAIKLPLYARSEIAEVWLVDLNDEIVEVYRLPVEGQYTEKAVRRRGEGVSPSAFPDVVLAVDDVLG